MTASADAGLNPGVPEIRGGSLPQERFSPLNGREAVNLKIEKPGTENTRPISGDEALLFREFLD